jgi:hypothetical protein
MKVRRSLLDSVFSSWSYCLVQRERLDSKFSFCVTLSVLVHVSIPSPSLLFVKKNALSDVARSTFHRLRGMTLIGPQILNDPGVNCINGVHD